MPLQVDNDKGKGLKIEAIIKDTIRKRHQEKIIKEKEEEETKEVKNNFKKKIEEMNENIRKKNQKQNERLKNKLKDDNGNAVTGNGMAYNLLPWGGNQVQFQQEQVDQKSSRSRGRNTQSPSPIRQESRLKSR